MEMKIEIKDTKVDTFSGRSKTGNDFVSHKQTAYLYIPNKPYPIEIKLRLDSENNTYPTGMYELEQESFYVNKYQQIAINPVLVPIRKAA